MDPLLIYKWFQRAMSNAGRKISLPIHTPPEKTYQYRAVSKFAKQVDEWGLSEPVACALVNAVVRYGKKQDLLNKGASLLNMKSVLKICHDLLREEITRNEVLLESLRYSKNFLQKSTANSNAVECLVSKEKRGGFTNFTRWYRSGDLSSSFISLSKSCRKALNLLPFDERGEFPLDKDLLKNRIRLLSDHELFKVIKEIMGDDLMSIGTQMEHVR
jgi:hypothetical protein